MIKVNLQNQLKRGKVARYLRPVIFFRSNYVAYVRDVIVCRVTKPACNTRDNTHGF